MLVVGLAVALAMYLQLAIPKPDWFQQFMAWCCYGLAVLAGLLGYGLRYVLAGDLSQRSTHVHEFVETFAETSAPVLSQALPLTAHRLLCLA